MARGRHHRLLLLLPLLGSCGANTDLTVAPPPAVQQSLAVELPPALASGRLPDTVKPEQYRLLLQIDPAKGRLAGEVFIDVSLAEPTAAFVLHGRDLEIAKAEVSAGGARLRAEVSRRPAAGQAADEELVLLTAAAVQSRQASLHLEYSAPLPAGPQDGIFRLRHAGRSYVFTHLEPAGARRLLPCFDDPIYKVPLELSVTVPDGNEVLSNAPLATEAEAAGGRVTFSFARTAPLPTYLWALAVGPLEVLAGPKDPVPLRIAAPAGQAARGQPALQLAEQQAMRLQSFFERPFPYPKLDLVAIPGFGPAATANAGLVMVREEILLLDPAAADSAAERRLSQTLAQALAGHYLGNLVSLPWWDERWLEEGLAILLGTDLAAGRDAPRDGTDPELLAALEEALGADARPAARPVVQPVVSPQGSLEVLFDRLAHVKAAGVLGMIRSWVGEAAFRSGLREHVKSRQHRHGAAAELWSALGSSSDKDVAAVARSFLEQPGVPLVTATVECPRREAPRIILSQRRFGPAAAAGGGEELWQIPVCLEHGTARGRRAQPEVRCTLLATRSGSLSLPPGSCPEWVLPNAGYAGYYRFALEDKLHAALVSRLPSLGAPAQLGFLYNAWALVEAGELPAPRLLAALSTLRGGWEPPVLELAIRLLQQIADGLIEPAARGRYQAYVGGLLLPLAKRLGWDDRPADDAAVRSQRRVVLAALSALATDSWLEQEAASRARRYLKQPAAADPDLAQSALRYAARRGVVTFEQLAGALGKTGDVRRPAVVEALASLDDEASLERSLQLVLDGALAAPASLHLLRAALGRPAARATVVKWLPANLKALSEGLKDRGWLQLLPALGKVCEPAERQAVAAALTPVVQQIAGAEQALAAALEQADRCIALRARQAAAVSTYLHVKER